MEQHLSWCKEITQVQIQENVRALSNKDSIPGRWLCRHDQNCDNNFVPAYVYSYFQKRIKKREHPISLDRKVVWVVSRATGDLCYMMPALLTSFKNSNIILQSWLMGFMLFFRNVFWNSCILICIIYVMCIYVLSTALVGPYWEKLCPRAKFGRFRVEVCGSIEAVKLDHLSGQASCHQPGNLSIKRWCKGKDI